MRILAPSNTIKLNIRLTNLQITIDLKEIETFNLRNCLADGREHPEPEDFVTAGDQGVVGRDVGVCWVVEDAGDPFGF
jgi:hypothetical protein